MQKSKTSKVQESIIHRGKRYHLLREVFSAEGQLLTRVIEPLGIHVRVHDIFEILFGALFISMPFAFSDELVRIGTTLPASRLAFMVVLNLVVMTIYLHQTVYRRVNEHSAYISLFARVVWTYSVAFGAALLILFLFNVADLRVDMASTLRIAFVLTLPASFGAMTVDTLHRP